MAFDFSKDYILENDNVRLVPLDISHLDALSKISNDAMIWTYFFDDGSDKNTLKQYIDLAVAYRKQRAHYAFVVVDKSTNTVAGTTRLYEYSDFLKTIKLGYTWYGKDYRGTMINKNCKYLIFEFIFETLQLERIGFGIYESNMRSIRALESVGCKHEGVLRHMFPALDKNGREDAILMSIVKQDWITETKHKLSQKINSKL